MPILTAHVNDDARRAARLLADNAVSCLENSQGTPDRQVTLNNVYRLIEAYKAETFFCLEPSTREASTSESALKMTMSRIGDVSDVHKAIDDARLNAFSGVEREEALDMIIGVLRDIAYPQESCRQSNEVRKRVGSFFSQISQNLYM